MAISARSCSAAATAWAATAAWTVPLDPPALSDLFRFGAAAVDAGGVTPPRILVAQGRASGDAALFHRAQRHLECARRLAERYRLDWLRLRVSILEALLAGAQGDLSPALGSLAAAVTEAEPEGVIRPFLDEGEAMAALLVELRAAASDPRGPAGNVSPSYLDTLLAAFPSRPSQPRRTGLIEPLTVRELDVLRLLAAGGTNAEIAAQLFVEQSTVKTHLIHLYSKLGVRSRTQAVARGRALRLVD